MIDDAEDARIRIEVSRGPCRNLRGDRPSTNMLLPVPTKRLMDRLPVLATNTYLPALVIQHDAVCPAAMTDANEPSRKRPSWFECASVISAVPSG